VGWRRNSLGKQRDEGRPSSPNRVVVVMVLLVDLTHTRPQLAPTSCLLASLSLSLSLSIWGPPKRALQTRVASSSSSIMGEWGPWQQQRREERERGREREKEESTTVDPLTAQCPPPSPHLLRALSGGVPAIGPT